MGYKSLPQPALPQLSSRNVLKINQRASYQHLAIEYIDCIQRRELSLIGEGGSSQSFEVP